MDGHRSFARNSVLNFVSNVLVLGIAFLTLPLIVGRLGEELFGLLAILWLFLGYANVFDVGMGQATVKFLAESVGAEDRQSSNGIVGASVLISSFIGIVVGIVFFLVSYSDFPSLFNISTALREDAVVGLRWFALAPPAILLQGSLKSVPLAFNRFDLSNGAMLLNGVLQWGGTAIILLLGGSFLDVIVFAVFSKYCMAGIFTLITYKFLPQIRLLRYEDAKSSIPKLLRFGGWISVTQFFIPFFPFYERFVIGGLLSLTFVAYYSVPSDVVVRLLVIPMSLVTTLIPFLSGGWSRAEERKRLKLVYIRSLKLTFVLVVPLAAVLVILNREIMNLWLGANFEEHAGVVLAILSVGALFNAIAQLPSGSLQALGRPDIHAKMLMAELVLYTGASYYCTVSFGIAGMAFVWTLRVMIEAAVLLFFARREMKSVEVEFDYSFLWKSFAWLVPGFALMFIAKNTIGQELVLLGAAALMIVLYGALSWIFSLDESERRILTVKNLFSPSGS